MEQDYLLKNLKVIARKVVETNNSLCFHLFCLDEITFYMNDSVKTCQKRSKMVYCKVLKVIQIFRIPQYSIMHLNWGVSLVEQLQENLPEQGHNTPDYREDCKFFWT